MDALKIYKAINLVSECFEELKQETVFPELAKSALLIEALENLIDDFIKSKIMPMKESIKEGEELFNKEEDIDPSDIDFVVKNVKIDGDS